MSHLDIGELLFPIRSATHQQQMEKTFFTTQVGSISIYLDILSENHHFNIKYIVLCKQKNRKSQLIICFYFSRFFFCLRSRPGDPDVVRVCVRRNIESDQIR